MSYAVDSTGVGEIISAVQKVQVDEIAKFESTWFRMLPHTPLRVIFNLAPFVMKYKTKILESNKFIRIKKTLWEDYKTDVSSIRLKSNNKGSKIKTLALKSSEEWEGEPLVLRPNMAPSKFQCQFCF